MKRHAVSHSVWGCPPEMHFIAFFINKINIPVVQKIIQRTARRYYWASLYNHSFLHRSKIHKWIFFETSERLKKNDVGNGLKMAWIFYEKEDIVGKVLV